MSGDFLKGALLPSVCYETHMSRKALGLVLTSLLLAAMSCATAPKKTVEPENDQLESENCCCRWLPIGGEGRASYEDINRMECSGKQGECMGESNCAGSPEPQ
jgi:hypothetical protein